jgi:hypothetical protein
MFVELVKKLYAEADPDDTGNVSPEVFIDILKKLVVECARRVQQTEVAAHTRELDTRTCMYTYF